MSVTSIRPVSKKVKIKRYLTIGSLILVLLGVVYLFQDQIPELLGISKKAYISVNSFETDSQVYINDELKGNAPIENLEIKPGLVDISIKNNTGSYNTALKIVENSENILYRELGISKEFSSGVNIWEDTPTTINTVELFLNPSDSKVKVNDKEVTKEEISNLDFGDYRFEIYKEGYKESKFQVSLRPEFKTNIEVKLSPLPYDSEIVRYQDYENVYVIKSSNPNVFSNSKIWLEYLNFFQQRRGLNIKDLGVIKNDFFDYYIDSDGKVYDKKLSQIDNFDSVSDSEFTRFGLLHKGISKDVATDKNSPTLLALLPKQTKKEVEVLSNNTENKTPKKVLITGEWLRIRKEPNGEEIGKANENDVFNLVSDETPGWFEIEIDENQTGFISSLYSEIID